MPTAVKKCALRLDANIHMGTGHLMRSLTLADELTACGVECHFLSIALEEKLREILKSKGHTLHDIGDDTDVLEALEALEADWLIVDHYGLDATFETKCRQHAKHIFVIDDLANRHHDCDILLDQNPLKTPADYVPWVGPQCQLLLGADHALLRAEFRPLRQNGPYEWQKGLICFGGADPDNVLLRILTALEQDELNTKIAWTGIAGMTNPHWQALQDFCATSRLNVSLLKHSDQIGQLLSTHDFAIGATGGMLWERMCIGIPTLAIAIAENQRPGLDLLKHFDLAVTLEVDAISSPALTQSLERVRQNASTYRQRNQDMLDGMGASRTVRTMLERA
ncbi:MAG: UDP-2,4-diacetamido-2,4,6-trideoxy-beta-L-altropyranose hydrolase [Myxococcota bacterium]|jgi:UDP-2,4-diacetamido-2,4,6-trideoxy-beta-L-altropyranose hydrolase|nr:UDP-2,4-diacetamido-2,4,6-trideoxy-beta-L-altropyranose hydrolase [Myxococcota bacterium]